MKYTYCDCPVCLAEYADEARPHPSESSPRARVQA